MTRGVKEAREAAKYGTCRQPGGGGPDLAHHPRGAQGPGSGAIPGRAARQGLLFRARREVRLLIEAFLPPGRESIRYFAPGIRISSMGSAPLRTAWAARFPLSIAVGIPPIKRAEKA